MGSEIERKFLVRSDAWRSASSQTSLIRQGYLNRDKERNVRVRTMDDQAFLTVKGLTRGATRTEFEYAIPHADAAQMLDELCERPLIEKRRSRVPAPEGTWEVDEFLGDNAGLIVAEMELPSDDAPLSLPEWCGQEVTTDPRYYNSNLSLRPFRTWSEQD